jgi:hypothetical protein
MVSFIVQRLTAFMNTLKAREFFTSCRHADTSRKLSLLNVKWCKFDFASSQALELRFLPCHYLSIDWKHSVTKSLSSICEALIVVSWVCWKMCRRLYCIGIFGCCADPSVMVSKWWKMWGFILMLADHDKDNENNHHASTGCLVYLSSLQGELEGR